MYNYIILYYIYVHRKSVNSIVIWSKTYKMRKRIIKWKILSLFRTNFFFLLKPHDEIFNKSNFKTISIHSNFILFK